MMVVTLVARVEMLLRLLAQVNAPLYALFLVGPPALVLDLLRKQTASRRQVAPVVGTPTPT
jgi:hypothetical protein